MIMHVREEESVVQEALNAMGKAAMALKITLHQAGKLARALKRLQSPPRQHNNVTTDRIPFIENNGEIGLPWHCNWCDMI